MRGAESRSHGLRRISKDVTGFAGSQYVIRFAALIKGFVVARILGPEGNGLWQHFVIISEYCQYSHLGTLPGLNKVLGHRIGEEDEVGARLTRVTGTGAVFYSSLILWGGLVAYVFAQGDRLAPYDRWGLPLLGLIVVLEQVNFTYTALMRAYSRIKIISIIATVFAGANLAVSLALLPRFQILGLLIGWGVTRLATTAWLVHRSGFPFRPLLHGPVLKALLVTGFPIYLFHLTRVGLGNIDRVLVDTVLDKSQLGIYGIAVTLAGLVRYVAEAVGFVIYPIFLRMYGATRDPRALQGHLTRPTEFLALLVPIVLGFSYLVLQLPILWLLPEYVASIQIYRLLTVSVAFASLAVLPGFYLMAIDRQNLLVPLGLFVIGFDFFVGREAIQAGWGLPGVAATMGAGSFVYATAVILYSCRFAIGAGGETLRWLAKIYAPVLYSAGVVALLRWGIPRSGAGAWSEVARACLEGSIFLAVSAPLLIVFERRTGFVRRLREGGAGPDRGEAD